MNSGETILCTSTVSKHKTKVEDARRSTRGPMISTVGDNHMIAVRVSHTVKIGYANHADIRIMVTSRSVRITTRRTTTELVVVV